MEEADAEGASNNEPDYSSVGSYEVQNGWKVLDDPAPTSEELDAMKETYVWTNKRLVHIWEMPFGCFFFDFQAPDHGGFERKVGPVFPLWARKADVQPRPGT